MACLRVLLKDAVRRLHDGRGRIHTDVQHEFPPKIPQHVGRDAIRNCCLIEQIPNRGDARRNIDVAGFTKHDRTERSIFDLLPLSPGIGFNHEGIQRLDTQCPRDNVLALNAVEQGKNHRCRPNKGAYLYKRLVELMPFNADDDQICDGCRIRGAQKREPQTASIHDNTVFLVALYPLKVGDDF